MNSEPSRGMTTPISNGHSEEGIGKPLMENGDCTFLAWPMYKRRKVSAIRDFPEGCGPSASGIDPVLKVDIAGFGSANGTIVEDKGGEHLGGDTVSSKRENDPRHSNFKKDSFITETLGQTSDCSLKKENPVVSSHQVDVPTLANDEPAKMAMVGMETLDTKFAIKENSVKQDSSFISKSSSPEGEAAMSDESKSLSLNINILRNDVRRVKLLHLPIHVVQEHVRHTGHLPVPRHDDSGEHGRTMARPRAVAGTEVMERKKMVVQKC